MSESNLIWSITFSVVILIVTNYTVRFIRSRKRDRSRKQEAASLGADRPIAQFPQFDTLRCLGCGSCVRACPEGDVLGIVNGRATVINGLKCIGHGHCAEACPIGVIHIGLGDLKSRSDIPVLSDHFETSVKGLFIVGELGGMALIKNAIDQGGKVIEKIAQDPMTLDRDTVDVIVVGAGPAGLSAVLGAVKHNLTYSWIDHQGFGGTIRQYPKKKLVMVQPVELPLYGRLDRPEYTKEELLEIWQGIQDHFKLKIGVGEQVIGLEKKSELFCVKTQSQVVTGRHVVLALGRRGIPRKLGVPGEEMSKVLYQLMDAGSYRDEHILVVGGGDSAVEAALALGTQPGTTVTLSYRKQRFFRIKQKNEDRLGPAIANSELCVLFNSSVQQIHKNSVSLSVPDGTIEIENDRIFVFAGGEPPFRLLKEMGVRFWGDESLSSE